MHPKAETHKNRYSESEETGLFRYIDGIEVYDALDGTDY